MSGDALSHDPAAIASAAARVVGGAATDAIRWSKPSATTRMPKRSSQERRTEQSRAMSFSWFAGPIRLRDLPQRQTPAVRLTGQSAQLLHRVARWQCLPVEVALP